MQPAPAPRPAPQSVLVTGGAGYIGSHVVLALLDAGHRVTVLDNLVTGFRWAVPAAARFVEGDIADAALVGRLVAEQPIDAVIHMAGSVVVPESVADPLGYYGNNTAKTCALLAALVAGGVGRILFSSTATLYGVPERIPMDEDCGLKPLNPYGRSKLMTETMLADMSAAHPVDHVVLRYFNVAGADRQGRSGQSTRGATHLIKVAVEAALGARDHVAVFGTDYPTADGTGVRDYVHVTDLADAHVAALELMARTPGQSHTLNVGYGRGYSVLEVLDAVDRVTNMAIERRLAPRREGDPAVLIADPARLKALTGWAPRFDRLDTIVADALAWERRLAERRLHEAA
jgi:UDP-glucose 4-epimerase